MSNAQFTSKFTTESSLVNLGPAIGESLARRIDNLQRQIRLIEYLPGQTGRVRLLENEISMVKDQLSDIRGHTKT